MRHLRYVGPVALLLWTIVGFSAPAAVAESAISCHCFRDRQYRPEAPAAADAYFLATVQNRLMAQVFGVNRDGIVKARMGGVPAAWLWLSYWLGQASGLPAEQVLVLRQQGASWAEIVRTAGGDPERLGPQFVSALARGDDAAGLARAVIEQVLEKDYAQSRAVFEGLAAADDRALVFAVALGGASDTSPQALWQQHRQGRSWGALMTEAGQSVDSLEQSLVRTRAKTLDAR